MSIKKVVVSLVVIVVCCFLGYMFWIGWHFGGLSSYLVKPVPFESVAWQAETAIDPGQKDHEYLSVRQRMLRPLGKQLPNWSLRETQDMLGPVASSSNAYFVERGANLKYPLGLERGVGFDSEWLLIYYDETGQYQSHEVLID